MCKYDLVFWKNRVEDAGKWAVVYHTSFWEHTSSGTSNNKGFQVEHDKRSNLPLSTVVAT